HAEPATREYLDWLLAALRGYTLAVELRHRSWSDDGDATRAILNAHRAAWTFIDEPKFRDSVRQEPVEPVEPVQAVEPASIMYVRLHGRNAAAWWDHAESEDRYDYL